MLKVVLFLLLIQQGCSSPIWKHEGLAEPCEISMDETRVLNNKEGPKTGQMTSTRVRTRQRVGDEQINSRRLVFENVGRFRTATLTENMEAPTRKPKQMPRTTQKPQTKNSSDATVVVTLVIFGLLILLFASEIGSMVLEKKQEWLHAIKSENQKQEEKATPKKKEQQQEIVLLEKDSKQNLISGSNGEPELVEPEVLIKQIYVKKDSMPTNSNDSVSEWKLKMNSKQGDTDELASVSADTGIDCDGSINANINQPLQPTSMDSNNTLVDAAIPTTSFQISKENSKHSGLAEPQKECKIDVPIHADECDQQLRDTKDALQERSIEDACAKNGVNNVASTGKTENECGNKKNAFNEADADDEVPKHEESDDSDVESDTSSIEISDIDSHDEGSL
eukprot:gene8237-9119_t